MNPWRISTAADFYKSCPSSANTVARRVGDIYESAMVEIAEALNQHALCFVRDYVCLFLVTTTFEVIVTTVLFFYVTKFTVRMLRKLDAGLIIIRKDPEFVAI